MPTTISIQPNRFIASAGKLDSNFRYIRRSLLPTFYLAAGKTMDVSNGGTRYVSPSGTNTVQDGSYNGGFTGGGAIGAAV